MIYIYCHVPPQCALDLTKKLSNWLTLSFISQTKSFVSLNEVFPTWYPKRCYSTRFYSWIHFLTVCHYNVKTNLSQAMLKIGSYTTQKRKFPIKDFFIKCDQIRRKLHFLCSVTCALTTFLFLTNIKISRRLKLL